MSNIQHDATHAPAGMTFFATSDITALTKGRALLTRNVTEGSTIGWVPANLGIGTHGHIVDEIPFGSTGDLRIKPDFASRRTIRGVPDQPDLDFVFGDIVHTDGQPWSCCARTILKDALAALHDEFGITLTCAFEHEFVDRDATYPHHPFSFRSFRSAEPIGTQLLNAMVESGLEPESWLPEYGHHQFEITTRPSAAVEACDRAILIRDLVRDVYSANGHRATFSPVVEPGGSGSGVHIHFSLSDDEGRNLAWDADRPGRVSELAGSFVAGILRDSPDMTSLFAPLTVSYQRFVPSNWSSARAFLGLHNREALVRIVPTVEIGGRDPQKQLHFEFRGADGGANPWLLLGSLVRAGLEGLREELAPAEVITGELDMEGAHRELTALPSSLSEALDRLEQSERVRTWLPSEYLQTFLRIKRLEVEEMAPLSLTQQCEAYADAY